MTMPTDKKPSRLTAALTGSKTRAVPRSSDQAFDQEVDEELQREWFTQLWDRYSGIALAGAFAIVIGVAGYKIIQNRRLAAAETAGASYIAAIKQLTGGKVDEGAAGLAAIAKTSSGFAPIARLRLAAADAAAGKTADAIAKYDTLGRDRGLDPIFSGYARLQSAMLSLDTASWDDMQGRLQDLASDNNPWRYSAQELLGMAAMKAGKSEQARAQFEKLVTSQGVPAGIAERARIVMGSIIAVELAAKAPAPVTAPAKP